MVSDLSNVFDVGSISKTTNGGTMWIFQCKRAQLMYGVDFIDSLKGYAVGTNRAFGTGYIYKTKNSGINWEVNPYYNEGPFWCIAFLDSLIGWIGGTRKILRTTDGGETWEMQIDGLESDLKQMIILKKDKVAYVLGDDWNGKTHTFLRADLSDLTDVKENVNNISTDYLLFNNYPNPFNPTTTIHYAVKEKGLVSLAVYDILGREVASLVNESKDEGSYSINFNANELPSGVYIYSLRVNDFVQNKKMTLLK